MALAVGVDIAKQTHWVAVVDTGTGRQLMSRKVENTPEAIEVLLGELDALAGEYGPATVAVDVLGGIAAVLTAMLHEAGVDVVHVPGLLVNRSRRATRGGERKSDPADAKVIADQVRLRAGTDELRRVPPAADHDTTVRLLVGRRRDLVTDQTRRQARLRDLLVSVFPGLERIVDVTGKTGLWLLTRYVTAEQIRTAGSRRVAEHMRRGRGLPRTVVDPLIDAAVAAAKAQSVRVPGEATAAELIRELASEILVVRARLAELDDQLEAALAEHPDAAVIRSMPGMGVALTAEFLAEAGGVHRFPDANSLASAAGLAPVLQQSGKMSYLRRSHAGNRVLKRVFYQSAFCAIQRDQRSRAYYDRKRAEGKRHHQALIALARRRINVLHAMLRTQTAYRRAEPEAAAA